jgi:hypothetical protein
LFIMERAGLLDRIGRENVCADLDHALARSRELLGLPSGDGSIEPDLAPA